MRRANDRRHKPYTVPTAANAGAAILETPAMPMRGELPCRAERLCDSGSGQESLFATIFAILTNPELEAVACFCALGFLIAIYAAQAFPNFGETAQALAQFP
jgi:hypothetical protein